MPPGDDEVQFSSPTSGAVQAIPPEHWDEAIKQGYKPTTHTVMYSPDGQRGMVHNSQLAEHMKQGYQVQPKTEFEKQRTEGERGAGAAIKRMLPGMFASPEESDAAKAGVSTAASAFNNEPVTPQKDKSWSLGERVKHGYETGGIDEAANYAIGPLVGMDPQAAEEKAERGDTGGILGQAAVPAAMAAGPLAGESIGKAIPAAKRMIGNATVDATGRTKPVARLLLGNERATALGELTNPEFADARLARQSKTEALSAGRTAPGPWTPARAIKAANAPPESTPISEGPTALEHGAVRSAQSSVAKRNARQFVPVGESPVTPEPPVAADAGESIGAKIYPEPRDPLPSDKPGAMWSVGREGVLPEAARRAAPGAGDVLRNIGEPILYTPREGTGYPGPKEILRPSEYASEPNSPLPSPQESVGQPLPAAEEEPTPVEVKGITASEKTPKPRAEKPVPIEKRFSRDSITDAEGLLSQESGAMLSADRPGAYYDENEIGDYNPQKQQSASRGITAGGRWRGVSSGRDMHPFMREHPEWGPEAVQKALRNKDSAAYRKMMEAALEFVNRGNGLYAEERAAIQDEPIGEPIGNFERRTNVGVPPEGISERRGFYETHKANAGPTPGEELEQKMRVARSGQSSNTTEGEALQRIMRDSAEYEKYKSADQKTRDRMLVTASRGVKR